MHDLAGSIWVWYLVFPVILVVLMVWIRYMVEEVIVSELQETVDFIASQLVKARDEIIETIAGLEAQVAAGEQVDLSELKALAGQLDAIVPDEPVSPVKGEPESKERG